jgi:hypothetical protein
LLAKLNYVHVSLMDSDCTFRDMHEPGSEINAVDDEILSHLSLPQKPLVRLLRDYVGRAHQG